MSSSVLEQFLYVFQPKDNGVEKKLDDISKKAKDTKTATEGVSESFKDFTKEARTSLEALVPGSDKMIDNLRRIGDAFKRAKGAAGNGQSAADKAKAAAQGGGNGGGVKPPSIPGAKGEGEAAGEVEGMGVAAGVATVALGVAAVAVGVLTKAFIDGANELSESRKKAQESGINSVQQAAAEQFAKFLHLDKSDISKTLVKIAADTQAGWVHAREFGNIFGLGNEQTQLLKHHGIGVSDRHGNLRNASAIFDDITKKMQHMSRETGIAFGQFFGMTKDMATAIRDSGQTFSQYAQKHQQEIIQQGKAIDQARAYEKAQQDLTNAWDNAKIKIGGQLLPIVTEVLDEITNMTDATDELGDKFRGLWEIVKDGIKWVGDLGSTLRDKLVPDWAKNAQNAAIPGVINGAKNALGGFGLVDWWKDKLGAKGAEAKENDKIKTAADTIQAETGKQATREEALARIRADEEKGRADFMKKFNAQTSDNAMAARTQLEAANLMKVATDRFGLSTEQYFALWAAKAGEDGGLRHSGGVTPEDYQGIYRNARDKYAPNSEWATALYGRGAPYMAQLPQQYVQGMKINPFAGPGHPMGLQNAKDAVNNSNFTVPTNGAGGKGGKPTTIEVHTGPITIQTKGNDPNEINSVLGNHLAEQVKYSLGKLNDGQLA